MRLADLLLRQPNPHPLPPQPQSNLAAALAVLDRAQKELGDSVQLRQAKLRLWGRTATEASRREVTALGENLQAFSGAQRARLLRDLAETWVRLSDPALAETFLRRLIAEQPADLRARLSLLNLVLQSGRVDVARQIVTELRNSEGGACWHYAAAALLLAEAMGPGPMLKQARRHLIESARTRPDWGRLPLLAAQIDEIEGRFDDAINHYKTAFDLGERAPRMVYRLLKLLQEKREFAQAEIVFNRFEEQAPLQPDMARLGAELALANNNVKRAVALGMQALPGKSRDYRDYLWLARLYQADNRFADANDLLDEAVAFAPHTADTWVAIVEHLALSGRTDAVPLVLAQVQKKVPADRVAFTLARCHEVLGQFDQAEKYYRQAQAARPSDLALLSATADFFRRSDQPAKAIPFLRKLLDSNLAPFALQAPARQQLALILAGTGQTDGIVEALELLATGNYPDDECTRFLVLGFDVQKRDQAIMSFEELRKRFPISAEELFCFARVQLAAGNPDRARDLLFDLVAGNPDNPQYLAHYTRSLLQGGKLSEAAIYLERLQKREPFSPRTQELKAQFRPGR